MTKNIITENIVYQAEPHQPFVFDPIKGMMVENLFETNKFEPFKLCCGQCYYLGMTKTIIANANIKGC